MSLYKEYDMAERRTVLERMKSVCKCIPDLDEKKELSELWR